MVDRPTNDLPGPREDLAQTLRRIYDLGLTTTSGGNLSLRDGDGCIWITPAGIDKALLRPDQISRVENGKTGLHDPPPSSELPFHQAIYAARSDLRAIVHAHTVSLVAFSVAGQVPDTRVSAHCHALCGTVGFASYALPGSKELGERIAESFTRGFDCLVLENHGIVVGGTTLRQAFQRLEALDLSARSILRARTIARERVLSSEDLALTPWAKAIDIPSEASPGTDRERTLRTTLCTIARRAHAKRLMTSTQGTLSARLSENAFLLTPSSVALDDLEPSDLLRVTLRRPADSSEFDPRKALHAAIYQVHPDVGAVAHGYAENTAGFCAAGVPLPSHTIPESYLLIREPVSVSFRATIVDPESVAAVLCPDHPVALVQNGGAIALGVHVLDAFDRLEVLEATAAAVIASRPLGELASMDAERLAALRDAFFPAGGLRSALNKDP